MLVNDQGRTACRRVGGGQQSATHRDYHIDTKRKGTKNASIKRNPMKEIPLDKGICAMVDEEDYEWLSQYTWFAFAGNNGKVYATRTQYLGGSQATIRMHREILGLSVGDGSIVDHKNDNPLDNRRSNLRVCTNSENLRNGNKRQSCTSKYKGVKWAKDRSKWRASTSVNGKTIQLGTFNNEEEAARAYDEFALKTYGEFARLNFPYLKEKTCK